VLYVFFILAHDRRRVLHFNVTENPRKYVKLGRFDATINSDYIARYGLDKELFQ
jgi:hypothetical protein